MKATTKIDWDARRAAATKRAEERAARDPEYAEYLRKSRALRKAWNESSFGARANGW